MRVSTGDSDAIRYFPLGGAPDNPVPGHVLIVLDVIEKVVSRVVVRSTYHFDIFVV